MKRSDDELNVSEYARKRRRHRVYLTVGLIVVLALVFAGMIVFWR